MGARAGSASAVLRAPGERRRARPAAAVPAGRFRPQWRHPLPAADLPARIGRGGRGSRETQGAGSAPDRRLANGLPVHRCLTPGAKPVGSRTSRSGRSMVRRMTSSRSAAIRPRSRRSRLRGRCAPHRVSGYRSRRVDRGVRGSGALHLAVAAAAQAGRRAQVARACALACLARGCRALSRLLPVTVSSWRSIVPISGFAMKFFHTSPVR